MAKDYSESTKLKKMKERQLAVSVEKILEKKKKMVHDAKGHILPLINTKKSPGHERGTGLLEPKKSITEDARHELYSGAYENKDSTDLINIAYAANDSKALQSQGNRYS